MPHLASQSASAQSEPRACWRARTSRCDSAFPSRASSAHVSCFSNNRSFWFEGRDRGGANDDGWMFFELDAVEKITGAKGLYDAWRRVCDRTAKAA
jgi:hypothetical protein